MKIRNVAIFGILAIFIMCALFQGVAAQDDDTTDDTTTDGEKWTDNLLDQIISTIVWVAIGLVLILVFVGLIDVVTDRMKHQKTLKPTIRFFKLDNIIHFI